MQPRYYPGTVITFKHPLNGQGIVVASETLTHITNMGQLSTVRYEIQLLDGRTAWFNDVTIL